MFADQGRADGGLGEESKNTFLSSCTLDSSKSIAVEDAFSRMSFLELSGSYRFGHWILIVSISSSPPLSVSAFNIKSETFLQSR